MAGMSLVIGDGERELELSQSGSTGIFVIDGEFNLPIADTEDVWAEGADSIGAMRVRSRPRNAEGWGGRLRILGSSAGNFWSTLRDLQDIVASAHRNRGRSYIRHTPLGTGGVAVTFDLEKVRITGLPENRGFGRLRAEPTLAFTTRPYGRLAPVTLASGLTLAGPLGATDVLIPGSEDGLCELTLTDTATQNADHLEVGVDLDPVVYRELVLGMGPALYWTLDDETLAADQSGNARNGTGQGGVSIGANATSPIVGEDHSTDLDGSNDAITSTYSPFTAGATITVTGWAYRDTNASQDTLFGGSTFGTGPECYLPSGSQNVQFAPNASSGVTVWAAAWPGNGVWVHWALVFNESTDAVSLYINGTLISSTTNTNNYSSPGTLEVGTRGASHPFDGKMAHAAVFTRALTADEIRQLYVMGPSPYRVDGDRLRLTDSAGTALAGARTTRAGSLSTNIVRATLTSTPVTICSTGPLPHKNRKKVRARFYASAECRVRLAWRSGDGKFTRSSWVLVPKSAGSDWYDVALRVVDIVEVPSGVHTWEGYVEAYATTAGTTLDVDVVEALPADVYSHVRATATNLAKPNTSDIADEFDQTAGNLDTPKAARAGGNWAEFIRTGANGFVVETTGKTAQRTTVSDTDLESGCYAVLGAAVGASGMRSTFKFTASQTLRQGVLLRYVDANNWLMVAYGQTTGAQILKRVGGGTPSVLAQIFLPAALLAAAVNASLSAYGTVDATGNYVGYFGFGTPTLLIGSGRDSDLGPSGALATGKRGIYDAQVSATANTRNVDNVVGWVGETDHVLWSGRKGKLLDDGYLRQGADGARYGKLPIEGEYLRIPASTNANLRRRIVTKRRRLDCDGLLPDQGAGDGLTADLVVTPTVALLG